MKNRDCESCLIKAPYAIGMVIVSVLITIAIEESRIASMRASSTIEEKAPIGTVVAADSSNNKGQESDTPLRTRSRSEVKPTAPLKAADSEEESLAKTARKMWENPAGKSMMNQGVKMAVGMMYQDFIDGLKLTKEEGDYFKNLLGKEMAGQQELGMKLMGAPESEHKALSDELAKRSRETEEEIKKFLNSDEDFKRFGEYKKHLPERQQLDGIRTAMTSKGVPLDTETETRLVDAMYRARTESNATDFSGPAAIEELTKGNIVENFEKSWDKQQETLQTEAGKILNETQMSAFQDYQKQMKEMQLMGLKMAEKMMPPKKAGSE